MESKSVSHLDFAGGPAEMVHGVRHPSQGVIYADHSKPLEHSQYAQDYQWTDEHKVSRRLFFANSYSLNFILLFSIDIS